MFTIVKTKVKNNKGLHLAVEIYKPTSDFPLPAVIIFHGFTGYKEENNLVDIARKLANAGIVTVLFTSSGFGDSEGTLKDDYRFSNHLKDAISMYEYIKSLPFIDALRMGVCGHSMGGKLAILFGVKHPELKAICVISAPITFFSTSYGQIKDQWKKQGYFEKVSGRDNKIIQVPYEYVEDEARPDHNVLQAARQISQTPVLFIAGKADDVVFWEDTKSIYTEISSEKQFILLDDIDHYYKRKLTLLPIVHEPIIKFFKAHL